jgi:2-hydroxychromene-2-carboxylate isomerase
MSKLHGIGPVLSCCAQELWHGMSTMRLTYYFWVLSDWAYLGSPRLEAMSRFHGLEVDFRPIRLLEVYKRTGGIPLGQRAAQRQSERVWELKRWRARLGMRVNIEPKHFPVGDEAASCLLIAGKFRGMDLHALSYTLMRALWAEDKDISDRGTLLDVAARFVPDPQALMAESALPAVLNEYNRYTEEAPREGVFGSPFYIFQGEPFWGQDRLDFLEEAIIRAKTPSEPLGRG